MVNFWKWVKYAAIIIGWLWAFIQWITQHPFPPMPH